MFNPLLVVLFLQQPQVPIVEPGARAVIDSMNRAYREIHSLEQDTDYENAGVLKKARMLVQRPNRLLLEITQKLPQIPETQLTRAVCDGKDLYVYRQEKGWFTQAKAPKDFKGFAQLASTLELAAIAGMDPFASLIEQARDVRLESPGTVQGEAVDVVRLDILAPDQSSIMRLYVGQSDHLLRRFAVESTAILPPLSPEEVAAQKDPGPPIVSKMAWEHRVTVNKSIPKGMFVWVQPPGALPYQSAFEPPKPARQPKKDKQKQPNYIWLNKVHPKRP